jgi:hypothetical protein
MNQRTKTTIYAALVVALFATSISKEAAAHGIYGHVHVTGWAIESLPDGPLREFFDSDPELLNAALFGAAFTDSGYFIQGSASEQTRAYSEHTHWEPFIRDFIALIVEEDPPPWETHESRLRVAFLMGCASHGLQDEIFDSLFLDQVRIHDEGGQEEADPATDGFLAQDGYVRWQPTEYLPIDTLVRLYETLGVGVDQADVERGVRALTSSYLSPRFGLALAEAFGNQYRERVPWTAEHYLDPEVPGSLASEVYPTARYLEAIWARLHGDFGSDDVVTFQYPEPPRRLRSVEGNHPDSWITLIFGVGLARQSGTASLYDADLFAVPFQRSDTRWGTPFGRLVRFRTFDDLEPGAWYEAHLAGAELIDGTEFPEEYVFAVQAPCESADDPECPDLGDIPVPDLEPPVADPTPEPVESVESVEPAPDMGADEGEDLPDQGEDTAGADLGGDDPRDDGPGADAADDLTADGEEDAATGEPTPAPSPTGGDDEGCRAAGRGAGPSPLWLLAVLGLVAHAGVRRRPRRGAGWPRR